MNRAIPTLVALALTGTAGLAGAQTPSPPPAQTTPAPKPAPEAVARADAPTLERAYLKELAFLKAEKRSLERRRVELQEQTQARVRRAKAEVDRLETRVLGLRQRADSVDQTLRDLEREEGSTSQLDVLLETLSRAREPVMAAGFEVPEVPEGAAAAPEKLTPTLDALFSGVTKLLASGAQRATTTEKYFLEDGTQTEGKVHRIGQIAAVGVSPEGSGALAPAGSGKLRLWPDPARETAEALVNGQPKDYLRLFLFESTETAVAKKEEKTFGTIMKAGGVVGWVIVGLGCVALLMALIRASTLISQGMATRSLVDKVLPDVAAHRLDAARQKVEGKRGATARVLQVTLAHLEAPREELEDAVQEALLDEAPNIERFGTAITVVAAVAPLLGLLGTVTGMIATFDIITEFGTGDPRMLSGGISEALITTQLGLIVAIPALLLGNLLGARADAILTEVEQAALRVVNAHRGMGQSAMGRIGSPAEPGA